MRSRYLRQIIYVKGRDLKSRRRTGCPLLFRNSFLSLCLSAPFSYEWCMTGRGGGGGEMERGEIKVCTTDTVKTQASALWEAHKQSDLHCIHRHTHNHTYMHSLRPVWFGNANRSHRAWGRTGEKRTFPVPELIQIQEILQIETSTVPPQWCRKTEAFIPPLFYIKTLKTASHFPRLRLL